MVSGACWTGKQCRPKQGTLIDLLLSLDGAHQTVAMLSVANSTTQVFKMRQTLGG
jgi:hypothetical protein